MKAIDRIILIALVAGVWALVLKPVTPAAHHADAQHTCSLSGDAFGAVTKNKEVTIFDFRGVNLFCNPS